MAEEQTLEVTIQNIVFQSDQGTFCVFRGENRDLGAVSVVYKGIAPLPAKKCALLGRGLNILVLAANLTAAHGKLSSLPEKLPSSKCLAAAPSRA